MPLFGGSKAQRGGCPFSSGKGYATDQGRMDWLRAHGLAERDVSTSLDANPDPSAPLYYWQIHSLLGPRRIEDLVTNFYRRVYADFEDTHFRTAFTQISGIEHHIATQTAFWIDVMGGGRAYHGGDFRLNFHHTHNAASVMNAAGATRWMYHMGNALCETNFSDVDARIKPCIVDFLRVKMKKYASQHGWRFNEADFDFVHRDPEMRVLYEAEVVATLTPDVLGATGSKELKRFLAFCGVDSSTCVEKTDLVELARSALRERIGADIAALPSLSTKELKRFGACRRLDFGACVEKAEMVGVARQALLRQLAGGAVAEE